MNLFLANQIPSRPEWIRDTPITQRKGNETVRFSRGASMYDNTPEQCESVDFSAFRNRTLTDVSEKKGEAYICSPMVLSEHNDRGKYPGLAHYRSKKNCGNSRILVYDIDGCRNKAASDEILTFMEKECSAFAYTTSSSTVENPRLRIIIECDREITNDERYTASYALQKLLENLYGDDAAVFDESVYNGYQPVYTPVKGSKSWIFKSFPISVDFLLTLSEEFANNSDDQKDQAIRLYEETQENIDSLKNALNFVNADVERQNWMPVVWGIRYLNWHSGEECARGWSQKSERYTEEGFLNVWESYDPSRERSVSIKSVLLKAQENGWTGQLNTKHSIVRPKGFKFELVGQLMSSMTPTTWIINNFIPTNCLGFVNGPPAGGKSLTLHHMAACIATGTPWCGHSVEKGSVLIIAGEGHYGITRRIAAWSINNNIDMFEAPIGVSHSGARLSEADGISEVVRAADSFAENHGQPLLIIVDTLHRNMGAGDENAAKDMGVYFNNIDCLRDRYSCSVITVHHTGHGDKTRGRGSSAIQGAVDIEFLVEPCKGDDTRFNFICTKMKDALKPKPISFAIKQVDLRMTTINGDVETSVVLEESEWSDSDAGISHEVQRALRTLVSSVSNDGVRDADLTIWRDAYRVSRLNDKPEEKQPTTRQAFNRAKSKLFKGGFISEIDGRITPTPKGQDQITGLEDLYDHIRDRGLENSDLLDE